MGPKKQKTNKKTSHKFNKNGRNSWKQNSTSKSVESSRSLLCLNDSERFLSMELYVSVSTNFKKESFYFDAQECSLLSKEFESATSKDESLAANFSLTDQATTSESRIVKSPREREEHYFPEDTSLPLAVNGECFLVYGKSKSSKYVLNLNPEFFRYLVASIKDKFGSFNYIKIKVNILSQDSFKISLFTKIRQELDPLNDKFESLYQKNCSTNGILECLYDASEETVSLNTTGFCKSSIKLRCSNDSITDSLYHDTTDCCESAAFKTVGESASTIVEITDSFPQDTPEFSESTAVKTRDELEYLNDETYFSSYEDFSESTVDVNSRKLESSHCPKNNLLSSLIGYLSNFFSSSLDKCNDILKMLLISKDSESKFRTVKPDDHIDFSESSVVFKSRNELKCLNDDKIVSLSDDSTYSSESAVVSSPINGESLNSGTNNSSTSLTSTESDPFNPSSAKGNDKLSCFTVPKERDSGPKFTTSKSADTYKFLSTNLSSTKELSFDSESWKNTVILHLLIQRQRKLKERFTKERTIYVGFLKLLESTVIYLTKTESSYFRKSKRNACIQSIYKKNQEEKIECFLKILSKTNKNLKLLQDSYRIQLIKLEEVFDKLDSYKSNFDICVLDENWKFLALDALRKLNIMDDIAARRLSEENLILWSFMEQFMTYIQHF